MIRECVTFPAVRLRTIEILLLLLLGKNNKKLFDTFSEGPCCVSYITTIEVTNYNNLVRSIKTNSIMKIILGFLHFVKKHGRIIARIL